MINYDELRKKKNDAVNSINYNIEKIDVLSKESIGLAVKARDAETEIRKIEAAISAKTKMTSHDIRIMIFAVGLQCCRQYLLTYLPERTGHLESAVSAHKKEKKVMGLFDISHNAGNREYYASLETIIKKGVPYDTIKGSKNFALGLNGNSHRYITLGHDPFFGWIFGTVNIMTNTMTTNTLQTYHISNDMFHGGNYISHQANTGTALYMGMERSLLEPQALAASLIKQALHLESDVYSKAGLPLPGISVFSADFSRQLANLGIDAGNAFCAGKQAIMSSFINMLIGMIHGLFYNKEVDCEWESYCVRGKKVISYSNVISASSNVLYSFLTSDYTKLDIGGISVAIYQLINNQSFIMKLEQEFIENKFYEYVYSK